jgi:hypothetical protein
MECYVRLTPTARRTRVEVRRTDGKPLLRASLPPLSQVQHHRAVTTLLEALSLWLDGRVCVALSVAEKASCFEFGLTDELGVGARSVFYAVEVVDRTPRRRGVGRDERQLTLVAPLNGSAR